MASATYLSPIRLFDHCGISYNEGFSFSRMKKQLNAEFEYSKDGFIEIEKYHYNKNDILNEIELTDFEERLIYHKRIFQNKNMLSILEDNIIYLDTASNDFMEFVNDEKFDAFFSPYFANAFYQISRKWFNQAQYKEISKLLLYEQFILENDREEAFKAIRIYFQEQLSIYKNISKENYSTYRNGLAYLWDYGWVDFMNTLPDEFYDLKNDLVTSVINLTVALQKPIVADSKSISTRLSKLQGLSSNLSELIINNDEVFNPKSSNSFKTYAGFGWIIFIIIRVIISAEGCH